VDPIAGMDSLENRRVFHFSQELKTVPQHAVYCLVTKLTQLFQLP